MQFVNHGIQHTTVGVRPIGSQKCWLHLSKYSIDAQPEDIEGCIQHRVYYRGIRRGWRPTLVLYKEEVLYNLGKA